MRYLSVCSGIEAATVAWHPLGWEAAAFSEIEAFPSAVLSHHYPHVPNLGDMTKHKEWDLGTIDLLVGGTPCQSFSVAGLRKGLDDPRGNLMLTYLAIADRNRPRWLVWENVPGVLSSNGGKDFGTFLGGLGELGYGFAYRVLDAQYFGVAQRRRRVFVIGYLGDWRPAAAVLFERDSLCGNPAPSREKKQAIAQCLTRGVGQRYDPETESLIPSYGIPGNWIGRQPDNGGNSTQFMEEVAPCLTSADKHGVAQPIAFEPGKLKRLGYGDAEPGLSPTLRADAGDNQLAVAQPVCAAFKYTMGAKAHSIGYQEEQSPTFDTKPNSIAVQQAMAVRRLTPVECERLQGFPDGYTNIPWRKQPESPDGPRYKALGNSMAVPVMAWIGKRIAEYEQQAISG